MLLEYCDRGSLQRAIERGKLQSRAPGGGPDLVSNCSLQTTLCCSVELEYMLLLRGRASGFERHHRHFDVNEMTHAPVGGCRCTC